MESIGPLIESILGRFGLGRVQAMADLAERWDDIAPEPWKSHARPLMLQGTTLVVTASRGARAVLKYAEKALLDALGDVIGEGTVARVEIRSDPSLE